MKFSRFYGYLFSLLCFGYIGFISSCSNPDQTLFEKMDADHTQVHFKNSLTSSDSVNILDFEYMFNGGGVGIGDINNDGLQDIYFTGNQVSGALYLNQGDFKFKDITKTANVVTTGWTNGVSISDINQDGLMDIYISKGGPRNTSDAEMANLAFINQGDKTFKEMANSMGIADTGYSIQGLFFDYDQDGDDDLYVLTNALVSFNRNVSRPKQVDGQAASTDRLYRNNGDGTFSDVSQEAGITIEGFGLGAKICDINKDGLLDIYVSNDFMTNDILYINNGISKSKPGEKQKNSGTVTFTDRISEYVRHQSFNGMGSNIADINNDGLEDIVVLDMMPQDNKRLKQTVGYFSYNKHHRDTDLGYVPQYIRNTLQLNNGNGSFSEIGQLSGIYSTDWSWSPLLADFDNDGLKDIFITNGYRRDVTNLDFIVYGQQASTFGTEEGIRKDRLAKLTKLPEVKLPNYIYHNNGNLTFTDTSEKWGITEPSYSNGAAYADLDNDGDLDIIVNNIDDEAFLLKNNIIDKKYIDEETGSKSDSTHYLQIRLEGLSNPIGTQVFVHSKSHSQSDLFSPVSGYLSTMDKVLHFGLGSDTLIDSLNIVWPTGRRQLLRNVAVDRLLELDYKDAMETTANNLSTLDSIAVPTSPTLFTDITSKIEIDYTHKEDNFIDFTESPTLIHMNSKLGPGLSVGDINADGFEDVYVGGTKAKPGQFFVQSNNGTFTSKELLQNTPQEDMGTLLLDVDADNDLDLILINGGEDPEIKKNGYFDRIYRNDGKGNFTEGTLLEREDSGSCVVAADYDKDGDLDLFIGGRYMPESYPLSPKSYLLRNDNGNFTNVTQTVFQSDAKLGMVTDALWTDFNNDSWIDLIVVGEYMAPKFFQNDKGVLRDISAETGLKNSSGWWNSIAAGDFDKDGDIDYVFGNWGLNSTYKASPEEPISIYAKDFDNNGSIDPLISCYRDGEEHLIYARDVLADQISAMKSRFKTYEAYAKAPLKEMFLKEELKDTYTLKAETLASSYIENLGNGKFKMSSLPLKAQFAPVFGMKVDDFNTDGNLDVLLTGNFYSTEALIGQYDAFVGLCLFGDGKGGFSPLSANESGLQIDGDAKGLVELQSATGAPILLAGQNSGPVMAYTYTDGAELDETVKIIPVASDVAYAIIHQKNKNPYRHEFAYGNGYLSQSSRKLRIHPEKTEFIDLFSYTGQTKRIQLNHAP